MTTSHIHHLTDGTSSVLLMLAPQDTPRVLHWGAPLTTSSAEDIANVARATVPPILQSGNDVPDLPCLFAEPARGCFGRPALSGDRDGADWSPLLALRDCHVTEREAHFVSDDLAAGLSIATQVAFVAPGVLCLSHAVTNIGNSAYRVHHLDMLLPVPARAEQCLDFGGRWCRERAPSMVSVHEGSWVREGREGRPGHDFPHIFAAATPQTANRRGEIWAISLAASGNWRLGLERRNNGAGCLTAGELLLPREVRIGPGDTYSTPSVYAVYSACGLDGVSDRFHSFLRARPRHANAPRPVYINSWEAVYFDHDLAALKAMASNAASLGVERFILDDGWFHGRRHDRAGLGDWWPDKTSWPEGLHPFISHVRSQGMDFGLWVEPEMVNPDSDLFRGHPEWLLGLPDRLPLAWRGQQVLNLSHSPAFAHVLAALDRLLAENDIAFLKWDHNRPLIDAGADGFAMARQQHLAAGRLIDALRERHPAVQIETCASGGGRIDLETVLRTDRVALSDCVDPVERQTIHRWSNLLLPLESCVTEIAGSPSHTTGRRHRLGFRAATAMFGQLGLQLDPGALEPSEQDELARWIALYKRWRPVLHQGRLVHPDDPDTSRLIKGVVAQDGRQALFSVTQITTSRYSPPAPIRLDGLLGERIYTVTVADAGDAAQMLQRAPPPWMMMAFAMSGNSLCEIGLASPVLLPDSALLLQLVAAT